MKYRSSISTQGLPICNRHSDRQDSAVSAGGWPILSLCFGTSPRCIPAALLFAFLLGLGSSAFAQPPQAKSEAKSNNAATDSEAKKTREQRLYEKSQLDHYLYRDRAIRSITIALDKAVTSLKSGQTTVGLRIIQGILDREVDSQIWTDDDERLTSIRKEASRLLRIQPAATLANYERLVRDDAQRLLDRARTSGDPDLFARVVRRFFYSAAGFQATVHLATTALDRGEYGQSTYFWKMLLAEPTHQRRLHTMHLAKAAVAMHQSGDTRGAVAIKGRLKDRAIRLGTQTISAIDFLTTLEANIRRKTMTPDWSMLFGNEQRNAAAQGSPPFLAPVWSTSLADPDSEVPAVAAWHRSRFNEPLDQVAVSNFPILVGDRVVVRDFSGIRAIDLRSGKTLWKFQSDLPLDTLISELDPYGRGTAMESAFIGNTTVGILSSDGQRVFAVEYVKLAKPDLSRDPFGRGFAEKQLTTRLISLDLKPGSPHNIPVWSTGLQSVSDPNRDKLVGHFFLGPPLLVNGRLYVLTEFNRRMDLLALDPSTGKLLWDQPIAFASPFYPASSSTIRQVGPCVPCYRNGVLVCPTQSGTLVGVDPVRGELLWTYYYLDNRALTSKPRFYRYRPKLHGHSGFANLPVIHGDRVFHRPRLSAFIHCIDLLTGKAVWKTPVARNDTQYIGAVTDKTVLLVGERQTRGLSLLNGSETWTRPLEIPSGHGTRINNTYLVPLKSGSVTCLNIDDGRVVGLSEAVPSMARAHFFQNDVLGIDLAFQPDRYSMRPANLIAHGDKILSLGPRTLVAYPQSAALLSRLRSQKLGDTKLSTNRLLAAELQLILGERSDQIDRDLLETLAMPLPPILKSRATTLMRRLLYSKLASDLPSNSTIDVLQRLDRMAIDPYERGRFLIKKAEWQLAQRDYRAALQTTRAFSSLDMQATLPANGNSRHLISSDSWTPRMVVRLRNQADSALDNDFQAELQRAQRSNKTRDKRDFLKLYTDLPESASVRLQLAARLIDEGSSHEAELLLIRDRTNTDDQTAATATLLLLQLWEKLGLHHEAAGLLDELANRFADTVLSNGRTGNMIVKNVPRMSPLWNAYRQLQKLDWQINRASISVSRWGAGSARIAQVFGPTYRRKFSIPGNCEFHLIDRGSIRNGNLTIISKATGIDVGKITIPAPYSHPWWTQQKLIGHFIPMGSRAMTMGISLLELDTGQPLWANPFQPLQKSTETMHVGPAGPRFCSFQTKQHLVVVDPVTGRIRWRRTDVEPNSGLPINQYAGLIGDDNILVMFGQQLNVYTAYDTMTGAILRRGQLDIDPRYQVRVFGRKLFYFTTETKERRIRIWDPLTDKFELDEPYQGRLYASLTPDDFELAFIRQNGNLQVRDVMRNQVQLEIKLTAEQRTALNYVRIFSDRDYYYINLQRSTFRRSPSMNFTTDLFLSSSHVWGELMAVSRATGEVQWKRDLGQQTFLRMPRFRLPFLVTMSRIRQKPPSMTVEVLDCKTGNPLVRKENIRPDRFYHVDYDVTGQLQLRGLVSRINIDFRRKHQRPIYGDGVL